jgi:D-glycero-alpha-D-manno-heptose-7-phosphate kinase
LIIISKAPLRISFAGGGTDVSPYRDTYGGCVINATINKFVFAKLRLIDKPIISFRSLDLKKSITYKLQDKISLNGKLDIHKAVYKFMIVNFNNNKPLSAEIITFSEVPSGSGLGSSSTLTVALIKVFIKLFNLSLDSYEIVELAYKIERQHCGILGGMQDQCSAVFGGFNFLNFKPKKKFKIKSLNLKTSFIRNLENELILFNTGHVRNSLRIFRKQVLNIYKKSYDVLEATHQIKKEALKMKNYFLNSDIKKIVRSLKISWENKKKLAKGISNNHLDNIYSSAINSGALAGKISGAGGGGFMFFITPVKKKKFVVNVLKKFGGKVFTDFKFIKSGVKITNNFKIK